MNSLIEGWSLIFAVLEGKYSIVGKVGAGLDYNTKEHLRLRLEKDQGLFRGDSVPEWIHNDYSSNDLPTDYVPKNNLQVLEVVNKAIGKFRLILGGFCSSCFIVLLCVGDGSDTF